MDLRRRTSKTCLRRGQDRLRNLLPGGSVGGIGVLAVVLAVILIWLATGFYTVAPNEVGINMIFGRYTGKTPAGWHYNLPYPIGDVEKLEVTDRNATDIGSLIREDSRRPGLQTTTSIPEESLMLTGDDNIADIKFRVIWQIDPEHPEFYAFTTCANPERDGQSRRRKRDARGHRALPDPEDPDLRPQGDRACRAGPDPEGDERGITPGS